MAENHAGGFAFQRHFASFSANGSTPVKGDTQRVDDASEHTFTYADGSDTAGAFYAHPFLDEVGGTEEHGTHVVLLKVHDHAHYSVFEFQKFIGFGMQQPVDASHAIAHLQHGTSLLKLDAGIDAFELTEEHVRNLAWSYLV